MDRAREEHVNKGIFIQRSCPRASLSLRGKLIFQVEQEKERAKTYHLRGGGGPDVSRNHVKAKRLHKYILRRFSFSLFFLFAEPPSLSFFLSCFCLFFLLFSLDFFYSCAVEHYHFLNGRPGRSQRMNVDAN